MDYRLQQYEDGTFGYLYIDGNKYYNFKTKSKVVCTQGEDEDRNEFIDKNNITFQKKQYGSNLKLDMQVNDKNEFARIIVVKYGYGLNKFVNDKDEHVREEVAKRGYNLDILINDENQSVRAAVAEHGYGLDILINDESGIVRECVAKHGYGLNRLVNDECWYVRKMVAQQGYGLDILVNDKDEHVRREVAEQGYGLDQLINDEDEYVRNAATKYLKTHESTKVNKPMKKAIVDLLKLDIDDFINAINKLDKDDLNELAIYADEINYKCEDDYNYNLLNSKLVIWLNKSNEISSFDDIENSKYIVSINEPDYNVKSYYASSKSILSKKLIESIFDKYAQSNHWCKLLPVYANWQTMYYKGSFEKFCDFWFNLDNECIDTRYKDCNDDAISNIHLNDIEDTNEYYKTKYQKLRAIFEENYIICEY